MYSVRRGPGSAAHEARPPPEPNGSRPMTATRGDLLALAATLREALDAGAGARDPGGPDGGPGRDWRAGWPGLAALGIAGLCVAEDCAGLGREVPAALLAARELGASLHGSPYPAAAAAS